VPDIWTEKTEEHSHNGKTVAAILEAHGLFFKAKMYGAEGGPHTLALTFRFGRGFECR